MIKIILFIIAALINAVYCQTVHDCIWNGAHCPEFNRCISQCESEYNYKERECSNMRVYTTSYNFNCPLGFDYSNPECRTYKSIQFDSAGNDCYFNSHHGKNTCISLCELNQISRNDKKNNNDISTIPKELRSRRSCMLGMCI